MTATAHLPDHAPFAPDAIAQLNRVIGDSSPTQRAWLSGFLAGLEQRQAHPAASAPPATKPKLTILFATESGNAEALAMAAKRDAARLGFTAKLLDAADATIEALSAAGSLLVVASTWGEGEPPQRATRFMQDLLAAEPGALTGVSFAVLALGDRAYAQFCQTGHVIDTRLEALGATRTAPLLECDLDYEAPAASWLATTLPTLRTKDTEAGSVIHVDFGATDLAPAPTKLHPFQAEILASTNLNSSRSAKQTFHVELDIAASGITYQPGDAIGIAPQNDPALADQLLAATGLAADAPVREALIARHDITTLTAHLVRTLAATTNDPRLSALANDPDALAAYLPGRQVIDLLEDHRMALAPDQLLGALRTLPPRLYSVASSQLATPDEAHLLIAPVRYAALNRPRTGVASTWIADRRHVGDTIPIHVKANPHFRLPADTATPLIMIGPGTGVAPFRAFMQEREALGANGRSWLFFGDQHYTHDFLYQLEWQDWLKRGVLARMDVAFSRDQDEKIYVQHRMLDRAAELYAWLQEGARVYVCGDQARMARDVHAALRTIIARSGSLSEDRAEAELSAMAAQGRYLKDVY